ncbi:MAG: sel1 repeat family protein [Candidatus Riflebacteria bacterium]|nr:sel1 repeat family protein [Candidatus Riflebacteria bacterium]
MKKFARLAEQGNADALRRLIRLAELGEADAQFSLGNMYFRGLGVQKDDKEAVKWWRKAAEQRDAQAQLYLGSMYYYGNGVQKNLEEAAKWTRKAAEQGNSSAQGILASMYNLGEGVAKDEKEAAKWLRKAAQSAVNPTDKPETTDAVPLTEKSVAVPRQQRTDGPENIQFLRQQAEKGESWAQSKLGSMYESGEGIVPQDYVMAHMWFNLASARGDTVAVKLRNRIANKMTLRQLEQAQELARNWKIKP